MLPAVAADNLLYNGDFEETTTSPLFGVNFTDWTFPVELAIETTDVYDGEKALRVVKNSQKTNSIQQEVSMLSEVTGQEFDLTIHYKVLKAAAGDLRLNCLWSTNPPADGTPHDSLVLNQVLPIGEGWQEFTITTTKPVNGTRFNVSVQIAKDNEVLFDAFSLTRTEKTEPWFTVAPERVSAASCNVNEEKLMTTFTIRQGNLTKPISLYITGKDRDMFRIEKEEVTAAEETVRLWYAPTAAGKHSGMLIVESSEALAYNTTFALSGTANDPTQKPEITINPTTLPQFTAQAGGRQQQTVAVSSINCTDYITVSCLNDGEGSAFTINSTMLLHNSEAQTVITFAPSKAGTYSAKIYWQSEGATKQEMSVTGVATEGEVVAPDWATAFDWDMTAPQALIFEKFEQVDHNKTLHLEGWQNVVLHGERAWWGYSDTNNDGELCAKATAYIWGATESEPYEMWLVTPALDYKNAANQVFTFRVRGDYLSSAQSAKLQLYYIDATVADDIFMQDLEIDMPADEETSGDWIDFQINLTGQEETMADVFFMAFRFTGQSGSEGAATYLIDDVSWGRADLPLISTDSLQIVAEVKPNEVWAAPVQVTGKNLTEDITVTVGGSNASKFEVAPATLPAEGGTLAVGFKSETLGVHQAYLRIRSRGAVDVYVPMSILVTDTPQGLDDTTSAEAASYLLLENGTLYIQTPQGKYTLTGERVE